MFIYFIIRKYICTATQAQVHHAVTKNHDVNNCKLHNRACAEKSYIRMRMCAPSPRMRLLGVATSSVSATASKKVSEISDGW